MRFSATIFFLLLLVNTFYYGIYEVMIIRAKFHSSQTVDLLERLGQLQQVKIPVKDARQYEGNEIWYGHQLFDVAKKETTGDTVFFYLYHDQNEEDILSTLDHLITAEYGSLIPVSAKKLNAKSTCNIQDQTYPYGLGLRIKKVNFEYKPRYYTYGFSLTTSIRDVPTPPPKWVSFFIA